MRAESQSFLPFIAHEEQAAVPHYTTDKKVFFELIKTPRALFQHYGMIENSICFKMQVFYPYFLSFSISGTIPE